MSTLPIGSPSHVQPASPPAPAEHFMAKPAPNQPTSSITSMQVNTATVTPEALALAMQIMSLSNPSPAAQGQQVITLPDGSTYVGETLNGKPHGRGVLQYSPTNESQRQRYEGEFANGLPDGEGYMTWLSGNKYIGGWKNGQMHGRGNLTYANGENSQGAYVNGKLNGEGVTRWPDGKVFTGIHEADKIKQGKLTFPDGDYMDGTFRDGKFWEGKKRWTSDAGYTYYNDYKNGQEERCTIL